MDHFLRAAIDQLLPAVCPVIAVYQDQIHVLGSSFVVFRFNEHEALLMTAKHVMDEVLRLHPGIARRMASPSTLAPPLPSIGMQKHAEVVVMLSGKNGSIPRLARLLEVWSDPSLDLSLFAVRLQEEQPPWEFALFNLDSRPVMPGTEVFTLGFPNSARGAVFVDDVVQLQLGFSYRGGKVVEHLPSGTMLRKYPGFSTTMTIPSGMSGGPVFEIVGTDVRVRGVVCSSMGFIGDEEPADPNEPRSFVSAIEPAYRIQTAIALPEIGVASLSLADLVRLGLINDARLPIAKP